MSSAHHNGNARRRYLKFNVSWSKYVVIELAKVLSEVA